MPHIHTASAMPMAAAAGGGAARQGQRFPHSAHGRGDCRFRTHAPRYVSRVYNYRMSVYILDVCGVQDTAVYAHVPRAPHSTHVTKLAWAVAAPRRPRPTGPRGPSFVTAERRREPKLALAPCSQTRPDTEPLLVMRIAVATSSTAGGGAATCFTPASLSTRSYAANHGFAASRNIAKLTQATIGIPHPTTTARTQHWIWSVVESSVVPARIWAAYATGSNVNVVAPIE